MFEMKEVNTGVNWAQVKQKKTKKNKNNKKQKNLTQNKFLIFFQKKILTF